MDSEPSGGEQPHRVKAAITSHGSISPLLMCDERLDDIDEDIIDIDEDIYDHDQGPTGAFRMHAAELTSNIPLTESTFSAFRPIQKPVETQIMDIFAERMLDLTLTKQQMILLAPAASTSGVDKKTLSPRNESGRRWFHHVPTHPSPLIQSWILPCSEENESSDLLPASSCTLDLYHRDRQRMWARKLCRMFNRSASSSPTPRSPTPLSDCPLNGSTGAPTLRTDETIGELDGVKSTESPLRTRLFLHLIYHKLRCIVDSSLGGFAMRDREIFPEILSWWDRSGRWGAL